MKKLLSLSFIVIGTFALAQSKWEVPEASAKKISPVKFNEQSVDKGRDLYNKNCMLCHGEPSKANYNAQLVPLPGDPASEKFQKETDGELFFKLSNGRGAMPAFKNVFGEDDRWNLISYIRSFNKNYIQPIAGESNKAKPKAWIVLRVDSAKQLLFVRTKGIKNKDTVSIKKADVTLFVKRYFGDMKLKTALTDSLGFIVFKIPSDIPGDKKGILELTVKINDDNFFGEYQQSITAPLGIPTDKPSLTDERAMWGVMAKAPIWLYVLYSTVVIGVWAFIMYIVFGLFKIWKAGQSISKKDEK